MGVPCTIKFDKTKSKWGRKEVEEDTPKRGAQGLAWQDRKERTGQSSTPAVPCRAVGLGWAGLDAGVPRGQADTDLEWLTT